MNYPRLGFFLLAACMPTIASATTVSPVILDVATSGRGVAQNVSVTNTGAAPLPVELTVTALHATATGFVASKASTDDLLVAPPTALIPPGQTQTFRVQWIGDPDMASSKHYYVSVNQLPVKLPEGQSAVQVVYNFQVLVSASSPTRKAQLAISAVAPAAPVEGKPAASITVENKGAAHGYVSQHKLKITETNAAGATVWSRTMTGGEFQQLVGYGLIASGQTRTMVVPLDGAVKDGKYSAILLDDRGQ